MSTHEPAAQQQIIVLALVRRRRSRTSPGLVEVVSQFATRVAEKARQQQAAAGAVHVFITHQPVPQERPPAQPERHGAAGAAHGRHPGHRRDGRACPRSGTYRPGFNYAKAGVMLVELRPEGQQQGELDLFGSGR